MLKSQVQALGFMHALASDLHFSSDSRAFAVPLPHGAVTHKSISVMRAGSHKLIKTLNFDCLCTKIVLCPGISGLNTSQAYWVR